MYSGSTWVCSLKMKHTRAVSLNARQVKIVLEYLRYLFNFIKWRDVWVPLAEAVNFWGNFCSGMLSLGSPAGPPAGSVAGLAILRYLSCLILCIGAHITGDNQDVRQVDSSPCDSFSAIRIGVMSVGPATASQLQGSTLGTRHSIWLSCQLGTGHGLKFCTLSR